MTVPPSLLPLEPFPTAPDTRASTPHIRLHGLGKRYPGGVRPCGRSTWKSAAAKCSASSAAAAPESPR